MYSQQAVQQVSPLGSAPLRGLLAAARTPFGGALAPSAAGGRSLPVPRLG